MRPFCILGVVFFFVSESGINQFNFVFYHLIVIRNGMNRKLGSQISSPALHCLQLDKLREY